MKNYLYLLLALLPLTIVSCGDDDEPKNPFVGTLWVSDGHDTMDNTFAHMRGDEYGTYQFCLRFYADHVHEYYRKVGTSAANPYWDFSYEYEYQGDRVVIAKRDTYYLNDENTLVTNRDPSKNFRTLRKQ